jgi:SAM-dependent methyltransferase
MPKADCRVRTEGSLMLGACRACGQPVTRTFVDLGMSPLANSFVPIAHASAPEKFYPLHVFVCDHCCLVQLGEFEAPEHIFSAKYPYYSSYAMSWLEHAQRYAADMASRFGLDARSQIAEVGSNDGYLLRYFAESGIKVFGIDPARNCAIAAQAVGVPTEVCFFGSRTAAEIVARRGQADLMAANNVLAHVPDLRDFVAGFAIMLKPEGVLTFEFPHLLKLMAYNQFDTIYHEHYSYLALGTVRRVLAQHGLRVFDVEELPTHGGSLRLFVCHEASRHAETPCVARILADEHEAGLDDPRRYDEFAPRIASIKDATLQFLIGARRAGHRVVGYGAPAKGNTFLNYCGVGPEHLAFTVDRNPVKQNTLLPGTRIPVHPVEMIERIRPAYLLILPWNIRDEIVSTMQVIRCWGGKFVTAIPSLEVF